MISLDGQRRKDGPGIGSGKETEAEVDQVDQVERFLGMVNWGNIPKPSEWAEDGEFDDAAEEKGGEVEDISALAEKLGAVDMTKST
jgi:hypothetical protein